MSNTLSARRNALIGGKDPYIIYEKYNLSTDGTNFIDTGFAPFSEENANKDFMITVNFKSITYIENQGVFLGCMKEASPYPGFVCRFSGGSQTNFQICGSDGGKTYSSFADNYLNTNLYLIRKDGIFSVQMDGDTKPTTIKTVFDTFDQNLLIGCGEQTSGTKFRYSGCEINYIKIEIIKPVKPGTVTYIYQDYSPNGQSFSHSLNNVSLSNGDYIEVSMDLTNCSHTNEDCLSVGNTIKTWGTTDSFHMYYTASTTTMTIETKNIKITKTDLGNTVTVLISKDGIFFNGTEWETQDSNYTTLMEYLCDDNPILIGSVEGKTRFYGTYNYIRWVKG